MRSAPLASKEQRNDPCSVVLQAKRSAKEETSASKSSRNLVSIRPRQHSDQGERLPVELGKTPEPLQLMRLARRSDRRSPKGASSESRRSRQSRPGQGRGRREGGARRTWPGPPFSLPSPNETGRCRALRRIAANPPQRSLNRRFLR